MSKVQENPEKLLTHNIVHGTYANKISQWRYICGLIIVVTEVLLKCHLPSRGRGPGVRRRVRLRRGWRFGTWPRRAASGGWGRRRGTRPPSSTSLARCRTSPIRRRRSRSASLNLENKKAIVLSGVALSHSSQRTNYLPVPHMCKHQGCASYRAIVT